MLKNLSIKNRIAYIYTFCFSVVLLLIFSVIYFVVSYGINYLMYETLEEEIAGHVAYIQTQDKFTNYVSDKEWEEVEHTDVALNPVFIAIYDSDFKLVDHSPNLIQNELKWNSKIKDNRPYRVTLNSIELLIVQEKLFHKENLVGYVVVGVSTKHNQIALSYLKTSLFILFPLAVGLIFLISRFVASHAIQPVFNIISTARSISESNLKNRIKLPKNKDELYNLTITINSLVDRLENQIISAKQFSADASHELRTPLAVIKGNLELLLRRERTKEEYDLKIKYTLQQVDRLYLLVEQFLLLSRVENKSIQLPVSKFNLKDEVQASIYRFQLLIAEKKINIDISELESIEILNIKEYLEIIIDNILSNAIKYVKIGGEIQFKLQDNSSDYILKIIDNGIGMSVENIDKIHQRFFRIEESDAIAKGFGLGLNIASKLAYSSNIILKVTSEKGKGTEVALYFKK